MARALRRIFIGLGVCLSALPIFAGDSSIIGVFKSTDGISATCEYQLPRLQSSRPKYVLFENWSDPKEIVMVLDNSQIQLAEQVSYEVKGAQTGVYASTGTKVTVVKVLDNSQENAAGISHFKIKITVEQGSKKASVDATGQCDYGGYYEEDNPE